MYTELPIEITSYDGDFVVFDTYQTWKNGSVSWIYTEYDLGGGSMVCAKNDLVPLGFIRVFTAQCYQGYANVTLYVHEEDTFDATKDNATVSKLCVKGGSEPTKTVSYSENGTPKRTEPPEVPSLYSSPRVFSGRWVR